RSGRHRDLHPFPTRRSSDLIRTTATRAGAGRRTHHVEAQGANHDRNDQAPSHFLQKVTGAFDAHDVGASRKTGCQATTFRILNQDRKSTRLNSSHVKISYAV